MNNYVRLNMGDLMDTILAAYPEHFPDGVETDMCVLSDFINDIQGAEDLADLIGRLVMLTMPVSVDFDIDPDHDLQGVNAMVHTMGPVSYDGDEGGSVVMKSIVRRLVTSDIL